MSSYLPDQSKLVKCPFNPRHVFTHDRLQTHIFKCMRNYPDHVICPYNALHRFTNRELLLPHLLVCPNRTFLQPHYRHTRPDRHGDLTEQPYHIDIPNKDDDEDWDSEYQT